jgi:hypothetical protein
MHAPACVNLHAILMCARHGLCRLCQWCARSQNGTMLKAKVETVLFPDPSFPKGQVNVNVEDGRVLLQRGRCRRPWPQ